MDLLSLYTEKSCKRMYDSIENPQWRVFKIVDEDGRLLQNKRPINSHLQLLQFIKRCKNPQSLYVSISTFLNPHKNHGFFANQKVKHGDDYFYPRSGYIHADCILLDSYFFIDLDSEHDLRIAQEDGKQVITALSHRADVELYHIQYSAKKGIHLVYKHKTRSIADPVERIIYIQKKKEQVMEYLLMTCNLKTMNKMHVNISKDVFRVYAVPYSFKSNGNQVTPLGITELMNDDIYHTLSIRGVETTPPKEELNAPASEEKSDDQKVAPVRDISPTTVSEASKRAGLSSHLTLFRFLDNKIGMTNDNYITVIKKKVKRFDVDLMKKLQKTYKLSDFYVEKIGDYVYAYNTRALQFKRVCKILRAAKSENFRRFITRKHLPVQTSDSRDKFYHNPDANKYCLGGKVVEQREKIEVVESEYGQYCDHSRTHSEFFGLKYPNLIGQNREGIMRIEVET